MNQEKWDEYLNKSQYEGKMFHFDVTARVRELGELFSRIDKKEYKLKILEIGTNHATLNVEDAETYILDLQENLNKDPRAQFFQGDMHEMPFENEFFDIVIIAHTLEHAISPYIALCEINRVLKKDGHLMIIAPNDGNYFDAEPNMMFMPGHFYLMNFKQICNICYQTGFRYLYGFKAEYWMNYNEKKIELCYLGIKQRNWNELRFTEHYQAFTYVDGISKGGNKDCPVKMTIFAEVVNWQ
jgi:SAM-dependent methyltransferase